MYALNQGYHKFHDNDVNMYVWDETTTSKGLQKIASRCYFGKFTKCNNTNSCYCICDMGTGQHRYLQIELTWLRVVRRIKLNYLETDAFLLYILA